MTTIGNTILEECARYCAFYGHQPDYVFLGNKQVAEIETMVEELARFGLIRKCEPTPRAKFHGMEVYRVDAASHLTFGVSQPSPCG